MENKQLNKIQKYRLYKRFLNLLKKSNCLFITFTFNDETLKRTNQNTRLLYLKRFLNQQANEYILNRDYGKKNNREHYHALIKAKNEDLIYFKAYKLGTIQAIKINQLKRFENNKKSLEEIAKDLTEHTTKQSTRNEIIVYSRTPRKNFKNPYEKALKKLKKCYEIKALEIKKNIC